MAIAKRFGSGLGAAVVVLLGLLASLPAVAQTGAGDAIAPGAVPPAPVIAIVDIDRIMRDSAAAKSVRLQGEKYQKGLNEQNGKDEAALRTAQQSLEQQRKSLSQDAFSEKARAFEQQVAGVQQTELKRRQAFDRSFNTAMNNVQRAMVEATHDVAISHRVNAVLVRQLVLFFDGSMDITAEIIDLMNQRLTQVEFPRPQIEPDAPGGAQPAQPAAPVAKQKSP